MSTVETGNEVNINFQWFMGMLGLALVWVAGKALDFWMTNRKDQSQEEKNASVIREQENTKAMATLSVAITALQIEVARLSERLVPLPKMQEDLNQLHGKVRELAARKNGNH